MAPARTQTRFRRAVDDAQKDQRREQILTAAKSVFAANGFHNATIGEVAKKAGISYGSVYWYYDSKDELFRALMRRGEAELRDHIAAVLAEVEGDSADAFRLAVRATLEFFEADRAAVKLLFRDSVMLGDQFEKQLIGIYESFIDDIEAVIADAQANDLIIDAPPRMIAFSVAALIGQIALRRLNTDDGLAADVVADFVVSLVLEGLLPR